MIQRGLQGAEIILKIVERAFQKLVRQQVDIHKMSFERFRVHLESAKDEKLNYK